MDKFDYITATIEEEKVRVEKIIKYLKENIHENDIVITQGAGTVTEIGPLLLK